MLCQALDSFLHHTSLILGKSLGCESDAVPAVFPLKLGKTLDCVSDALPVSLDTMTLMHTSWFLHLYLGFMGSGMMGGGGGGGLTAHATTCMAGTHRNSSSMPSWADIKGKGVQRCQTDLWRDA